MGVPLPQGLHRRQYRGRPLRLRPDHRNETVRTARIFGKAQTIAEGHWPSQIARGCVEASHGAMIGSLRDALSREAWSHRDQGE